jgi:sec-independent protein translocase protein TatA
MNDVLALFNLPGGTEWLFIGLIALLLFGKRLPDIARSFGRSIMEFKKGIRDVRDDMDAESAREESARLQARRTGDGGRPPESAASSSTPSGERTEPTPKP